MKKLRKISRVYYLRQILACWLVIFMAFGIPAQVAMAYHGPDPTTEGPNLDGFVHGTGTINQLVDLVTDVTVQSPESIIHWHSVNTIEGEALNFFQGEQTGAAVLNRVVGYPGENNETIFNGNLNAESGMRIFMVNPAGIVFGSTATINVTQLVASSLEIDNDDFINGLPYTFIGGTDAGDVENYATDITAEVLALIGKNVLNEGALIAEDLVIMAAGDTVLIREDGSSVAVKVTMPDGWVSGNGIHDVKNNGDGINVDGDTAQVILAAGDVWSAALVKASSDGGSDAVATVEIDAAGDVVIEDDIKAVADGDGVGGFDAIAKINIKAAGSIEIRSDGKSTTEIKAEAYDGVENSADVKINGDGDVRVSAIDGDTRIKALAYDGDDDDDVDAVLNEANIEITGANVNIISENSGGFLDFLSPDDALIYAYAHDGGENIANVSLTANGTEGGNVTIESEGQKGDDVLVKAEAKNYLELPEGEEINLTVRGLKNTATVDIEATGNAYVKAYGVSDEALVKAEAWNEIKLAPVIPPDFIIESVLVEPDVYEDVEVPQEAVVDLAVEDLVNTATVDITAGEDVEIKGSGSGDAAVEALAHNDIEVDIDNADNEVTVNLRVADLDNEASVTVTATEKEVIEDDVVVDTYGGGVELEALGLSSKVGISAKAYNELEIEQHSGDKYWVWDGWFRGHWEYIEGYAAALNLTVSDLDNIADITINADNVVEVGSQECLFGTVAKITADAYNDFVIDLYTLEVDGGDDIVSTGNLTLDGLTNKAGIDVTAGGDVLVTAGNGGESGIAASASNTLELDEDASGAVTVEDITNISDVDVTATEGNVEVIAECEDDTSDAYIYAEAFNEVPEPENEPKNVGNTATVNVTAGEDVKVMGFDDGFARIAAITEQGVDNTSGITIAAQDGDVLVLGVEGDAGILAEAREGDDNTATIKIDAVGGDVKVIDIGEGGDDTAKIEAIAEDAINSNTADIQITATATTSEREKDGLVYVDVDGGDVKVKAKDGGDAGITAFAGAAGEEGDEGTSNTANVTIRTTSAEGTTWEQAEPPQAVTYTEGGDVKVIGKEGSDAEIEAIAKEGETNTADVLICIDGGVTVEGDRGGEAEIEALAKYGYSNTANVGIGAKGEEGVKVIADRGGEAGISSKAKDSYNTNTASTIVCTQGGVDVIAQRGGDAEILAQAKDGLYNDAYVGIGAMGDVVVRTGQVDMPGCYALIRAEAEGVPIQQSPYDEPFITTADAEVVVFSHEGSVEVLANNNGHSGIEAEAQGAHLNTANVGVAAAADLSPADVAVPDYPNGDLKVSVDDMLPISGNVIVKAYLDSKAQIMAWAHDATNLYEYPDVLPGQDTSTPDPIRIPGENTADVVVCAPGEVRVLADEGSDAKIKSWAGGWGEDESINSATTQVYASDVKVDVPDRRGNGITAWAVGSEKVTVPDVKTPGDGRLIYCLKEDGLVSVTDGSTLIVDTYANRKDCPDCPPCPCGEEPPIVVAAALVQLPLDIPLIVKGCPGLIKTAANELEITPGTIQVSIGNALALNPTLQACDACATLIEAAGILRDEDGSRMAAMVQVFNEMAPGGSYSPEMQALIATAFTGAAEGSQYATVREYTDAFIKYYSVLETKLGSPVGDSLAFVMNKYGAGVLGSENDSIRAFLAASLESGKTFGN